MRVECSASLVGRQRNDPTGMQKGMSTTVHMNSNDARAAVWLGIRVHTVGTDARIPTGYPSWCSMFPVQFGTFADDDGPCCASPLPP